ncbi:MAG: cyclic nucleotide-binding domain-containing protein [Sedimentisphaerales bacterium]|nr:cyclic nucleotide-binding domain-containing protein [Sedimentisphaerales bacterium]
MANNKKCEHLTEIEDVLSILNKISIFAGLNDEQLHSLFQLLETIHYDAGETIFEQGDHPSHIYVVRSGRIKLVATQDDTPFELVVFDQGQCFGESSVIGIQPHAATAIAVEETELIALSRQALLSIYETDLALFSTLIMNIARETCRRLRSSSEVLLHYVKKSNNNHNS